MNSVRSAATNISSRPGQYSAVRATGGKRLLASQAARQSGVSNVAQQQQQQQQPPPATSSHSLQSSMRNKQPAPSSRRNVMPSNASVRSFQSDLERINEDYNKTYAYTGQTSASAMRSAATRGRRAESIISSAASDTSEIVDGVAARRKGSRVSFSDIDENEVMSRGVSPNPATGPARSAMKQSTGSNNLSATAAGQASPARLGIATNNNSATTSMPPPALVRRGSNASLRSNTSTGLAPPLAREVKVSVPAAQKPAVGDDQVSLSTIHSHGSVYSDADEDFRQSPAKSLLRNGDRADVAQPLALTQQNLAAVDRAAVPPSPLKSAMRKTNSQAGSVRFDKADVESNLDADDESDDSFSRRRKANRATNRSMRTSLRSTPQSNGTAFRHQVTSPPAQQQSRPQQPALVRSNSNTSRMSTSEPTRMRSLRRDPSMTNMATRDSPAAAQSVPRRASITSLRNNPPAPPMVRRGSVAGSVAGSVRDEAVDQHIAALAIAQRNVQKLLHPEASSDPVRSEADAILAADTAKKLQRRSSFERKRQSQQLQRRDSTMSIGSMADRTFRTTLRKEKAAPAPAPAVPSAKQHRRSQSSTRTDSAALQAQRAERPKGRRSLSMLFGKSSHTNVDLSTLAASLPSKPQQSLGTVNGAKTASNDAAAAGTATAPTTPKKQRFRRFSINFSGKKDSPVVQQNATDVPPVPAIPPQPVFNPKVTSGGRRLSLDSDDGDAAAARPKRESKTGSALRAGSLRSPKKEDDSAGDAQRPAANRTTSGQTTATTKAGRRLSRLDIPPPDIPDKSAARSPSLPPQPLITQTEGATAPETTELQVPTLQTVGDSISPTGQQATATDTEPMIGKVSITRPQSQRFQSELSVSKRTGKPKKFQKLRKILGIRD